MRKIISVTALLLATVTVLFTLASCLAPTEPSVHKDEGAVYVSLRINPEIELITDDNGTVLAANAVNEDGECVLSEIELTEKPIEEAAEAFTQTATELGYIDPDSTDNVVYVDVLGENEESATKVKKSLSEKINRYFENNGIYGKVSPETLDRYREEVDAWNVSAGHAKMILRILDLYPDMTSEELLAMSVKERITLLKDDKKNNGMTPDVRAAYAEDVKALREEYRALFEKEETLKVLKEALKNEALTEDERHALTEQYDLLRSECETLRAEYKEKLAALKKARQSEVTSSRTKAQKEAQKRRENHEKTLEKHREKVEKNKDDLAKSIRDWQNGN
ncbi:MAG: hypothetical protein IKC63_00165 [Clostridia bacterium]|nr:hypothetical protein [Clostridia bacterium]